jgi:hypothetical protein
MVLVTAGVQIDSGSVNIYVRGKFSSTSQPNGGGRGPVLPAKIQVVLRKVSRLRAAAA